MRKLFGTDGIRGRAHVYPLDVASMLALGESTAHRLRAAGISPVVILGMDTRESGPEIALALREGIRRGGGNARFAGVIPTPGVAYLCRERDAGAAVSISASHNPWHDNGVKLFGHDGMKLSDEIELRIEEEMLAIRNESETLASAEPLEHDPSLSASYVRFLESGFGPRALAGRKIVVDAGNGAAFEIGVELFRRAGADVVAMFTSPDGKNINENCGALHPEAMAARVIAEKADFGVSFDGDADRVIFADDRGVIRNGDEVLYLIATRRKAEGQPGSDVVVATVMSNLGFEKRLAADGIELVRANVGDKYVLEKMLERGATIGGEQSGHVIDLACHTTGDGIHTALVLGAILARESRRFSEIETFAPMPQILLNRKVGARPPLDSLPRYREALAEEESRLAGEGRILVRYSGTENLVRVMIEGPDAEMIRGAAERLTAILADEIG
ncbi:MAG: phosphoglucosamine mutase [Acidobacteria bacterium]|nr:phosphoglucosamine mutase [Acidobacteriota bacterium]